LLLWRDGDNDWQARLIRDAPQGQQATWNEGFEETQILWGTRGETLPKDFTLMTDGQQRLAHAVPREASGDYGDHRPLRLHIRHYVAEDESGFTRVVASRLLNLTVEVKKP
jgi:CRISPR-associated protein (TIGR03984 family)